ncbi:MAG: segregation/condensation protein A [Candidatus Margulisiibacteriota bacterium]
MQTIAYEVETEVFKGPFDLLLKAIDDGQVDIFKVSVSQIVAAFFDAWRKETINLIVSSDFLIMAAYLLEMKSKALLPSVATEAEEEMLGSLEDSLISHLQEYETYKNIAQTLRQRKEVFEKIYGRHEGEAQEKEIELVEVSLKDLVQAFKRVYDQAAKREKVIPISTEEVTLEQRVQEIKDLLTSRREGVPFIEIFIRKTRLEIVVTFLAILELAKQNFLRVVQDRRFSEILIMPKMADKVEENGIVVQA